MKPLPLPSINLGIPTKTSSGIWRQRVHQETASFRYNVHNGANLDGRFGWMADISETNWKSWLPLALRGRAKMNQWILTPLVVHFRSARASEAKVLVKADRRLVLVVNIGSQRPVDFQRMFHKGTTGTP